MKRKYILTLCIISLCARNNIIEAVKMIEEEYYKEFPLHHAVTHGDTKYIENHLKQKPKDVNKPDHKGNTPLHTAIDSKSKCKGALPILLNNRADVNQQNKFGQIPLHRAVELNEKKLVQTLLNEGGDVSLPDSNGDTPLDLAILYYRKEIIKLILQRVHNLDDLKLPSGYDLNKGWLGDLIQEIYPQKFPLHYAIRCDDTRDLIRHLNQNSDDVNKPDHKGDTPLHMAVYWNCKKALQILLDNHADVDQQNKSGQTPLDLAVYFNRKKLIQILSNHGENLPDDIINIPLML